ncbi:MAG: hypothetical protein AAGB19_03605 [Cyanobacteria bacterium P01_F01_bin.3]
MSQTNYSQYHARAFPGQMDGLGGAGVRAMVNSALDAKNTWTIAIPASPDDSADYSVSVSGGAIPVAIVATYSAGASSTQAEVVAGLLAAIQASDIGQFFAISETSNVITLEALTPNIEYAVTSPTNGDTTADLTVTETLAESASTEIPDGRFVVRSTAGAADNFNEARLPTSATNVVVAGVTTPPTHAREHSAVGNSAKAAYQPNDVMDVVTQTVPGDGIWVTCDAGDIGVNTTAYIDVNTADLLGAITATSTSNLALPAGVRIMEPATPDPNGGYVVKVALNLP